jgi:hypothetical protein
VGHREIQRINALRVLVIEFVVCSFLTPSVWAQGGGNVPSIRVETRQVLVSVSIIAKANGSDYDVLSLNAADFRLFEDGKEQKIDNVALERAYRAFFEDNLGVDDSWAVTPRGKWSRLAGSVFGTPVLGYYYVMAYTPPSSKEEACHQIKVKVVPKGASGNSLITGELGPVLFKDGWHNPTVAVDRSNLLVNSRREYCNLQYSSSDTLYGTKTGQRMESFALGKQDGGSRLLLQTIDFPDESGSVRLRIVLDFPSLTESESGMPSFLIGVLGMIFNKEGILAGRFSESLEAGCHFPEGEDFRLCRQHIPNHYETEIPLPSGDYNLQVVLDSQRELYRVGMPVSTVWHDGKRLVVSGIALCRRFHEQRERLHNDAQQAQSSSPSPKPPMPAELSRLLQIPAMPFELAPLVSKGIEFTPTGDTRFKRKESLIAYFELHEPLLQPSGTVSVQFQMRITDAKTGKLQTDTGLRPADSFIQAGKAVIPIAQQIAIGELQKGDYRLEVQASDSAGNRTEWRATTFTVE